MELKNIVKMGAKIAWAKACGLRFPLKVKHYMTYRCNLACPFCGRRSAADTDELSTSQIKEAMSAFKKMGTRFWQFSGGEPLLRPDLPELVAYAKDRMGFHLTIATNGTLLKGLLDKHSALRRLDFVQISLDGPPEVQNRYRGAGAFEGVVEALQKLKSLSIATMICTVITKDNIRHYDDLVQLAASFRARIAFQPMMIHPQDYDGQAVSYFPGQEDFRAFIDKLMRDTKRGSAMVFSPIFLKAVRDKWPDQGLAMRCYAGIFYCDITPDGYVVPCCLRLAERRKECFGPGAGYKESFFAMGGSSTCKLPCSCSGPQELNIALDSVPMKIPTLWKHYRHRRII